MKEKKSHESASKHKHKKSKKHKKEKHRKSSSDHSDSDEVEWVEAPPPPKAEKPKDERQEWMSEELFVSTLSREEMKSGSSSRERKKLIQEKEQEKEEAIKQSRELNPHWKNNGSGLPTEESCVESLQLPTASVGDGGYAYLKKAYIRIQEQAQREGRSMEEVAVERWGSLDKLVSMIEEAESRMKTHSQDRYKSHHKYHKDYRERGHSSQFQKPSDRQRSQSPENSYRFQKPRDYDRNKKKSFLVSKSTDQKRKFNYDVSAFDEKDNSALEEKITRSGKDDCMVWERSSSSDAKPHVPAWKKAKHVEKSSSKKELEIEEKEPQSICEEQPSNSRKSASHKPEVICSEDDLNRLAAKYFKANMSGDVAEASKLKAELDKAREDFKSRGNKSAPQVSSRQKERVLLTKINSSGHQQPIHSAREEAGFDRNSGSKKRKEKFFDDSSRYSLKQMFEREKLTTADDNLEMFLDVAAECNDKNARDEDDETSDISKKARQKMSHTVQEEKDIGRAIKQHQKMNAALEKCEYCMDNSNMKRHLIVSVLEHVYLCIPNFQTLTEHHCLIVPKRHVSSFLQLDEDEWNDVEELKNTLRHFFKNQNKSLLCLETSMYFRHHSHALLECIPVPEEEGDMAPLYFKKALLESEEEWTHNIKLVDLTGKGLRRSIPKNLPYFCISFDPSVHAGFAHVIEDEKQFPRNFGKEVVGGMLDIDYNYLYKNRKDDSVKKSSEALQFTRMLEEFTEGRS